MVSHLLIFSPFFMNNITGYFNRNRPAAYTALGLVLVLIVGGGVYAWMNMQNGTVTEKNGGNSEGDIDTSTWATYRNEEFGFEFQYPDDRFRILEISGSENLFLQLQDVAFVSEDYGLHTGPQIKSKPISLDSYIAERRESGKWELEHIEKEERVEINNTRGVYIIQNVASIGGTSYTYAFENRGMIIIFDTLDKAFLDIGIQDTLTFF
jgi:hypothetical protein